MSPILAWKTLGVLFENRPALYFFNYTFISVYKIYSFIPYQRYCFGYFVYASEFIANRDCKNENISPYLPTVYKIFNK